MALVGTISGSNGTSTTAISGSLIIADEPGSRFPVLDLGVKLFVSGNKTELGSDTPNSIFGGDAFVSGAFGTDSYFQMKPVGTLRIPTNTTASYIYTSGSTNDLYFTQYQPGTGYTNTTRLRWLESSLGTGLLHGGVISTANGTTTFSVTSGSGIIVTQNASTSTDPYPTVAMVEWQPVVSQSLTYVTTNQITYISVDSSGVVNQSPNPLTISQKESNVYLGRVLHQASSVTNGTITEPAISYGLGESTLNFQRAFGPLKLSGHVLAVSQSAGLGTLGLIKTAGDSYVEGRNYSNNPNSPNLVLAANDPALTDCKIFREYTDVNGDPVINTNGGLGYAVIDPTQYNNGGSLAVVNNNEWSNQRVFWYPRSVNRALYVYYGPRKYSTFNEAVGGLGSETFTEGANTLGSAVFVGVVTVKANETTLDAADAQITQGPLHRGAGFGGGGGGSTSPGGSNTYVQFNDSGGFGGDAGLVYNKTTDSLSVAGNITGSNLRLTGDVEIVGGDVTSSAAIFNFIPSGSTGNTLNIGETTGVVQIGKATGPTTVRLAYGNTTSPSVKTVEIGVNGQAGSTTNITMGSTASSGRITLNNDVALATGNIIGAPGAGANVMTLISSGNIIAKLDTDNSVDGHKFAVQDYRNIDQFTVGENGNSWISGSLIVTGSVAVNGGDITSTAATCNIFNTTPTTVNIANNASNLYLGKSGANRVVIQGNLLLNGNEIQASGGATALTFPSGNPSGLFAANLTITGDVGVNGGDLTTTAGSFNLLNATATSIAFGGAATSMKVASGSGTSVEIGSSAGRTTVYNDLAIGTGNIIGAPGAGANVMTLISSGNIIAKLDTDNSIEGHRFAIQDYRNIDQFSVGENGNAELSGSLVISGTTLLGNTIERLLPSVGGTGVVSFDMAINSIFYVNGPTGDITANFTNVSNTNNRVLTPTVVLSQSATPRMITNVQVNGSSSPILWANKTTPTATANQQDVFGFSLIRSGSVWTVLGQLSTYG